jgi:hypothetical protein|tara:strand:- start:1087 stop:1206 length:120 start_codon:yes stop_codon:yes gene_type:complete
MTHINQFDPVSLKIMWSRMRNVAEEMWTTIVASDDDFGS